MSSIRVRTEEYSRGRAYGRRSQAQLLRYSTFDKLRAAVRNGQRAKLGVGRNGKSRLYIRISIYGPCRVFNTYAVAASECLVIPGTQLETTRLLVPLHHRLCQSRLVL